MALPLQDQCLKVDQPGEPCFLGPPGLPLCLGTRGVPVASHCLSHLESLPGPLIRGVHHLPNLPSQGQVAWQQVVISILV